MVCSLSTVSTTFFKYNEKTKDNHFLLSFLTVYWEMNSFLASAINLVSLIIALKLLYVMLILKILKLSTVEERRFARQYFLVQLTQNMNFATISKLKNIFGYFVLEESLCELKHDMEKSTDTIQKHSPKLTLLCKRMCRFSRCTRIET